MKICDICFNTKGESKNGVSSIIFSDTDEMFDLCESHYQQIREFINGRTGVSSDTYEAETYGA
jgi:phosphoribosylaminoimidazole-succinocarboxamide synthase